MASWRSRLHFRRLSMYLRWIAVRKPKTSPVDRSCRSAGTCFGLVAMVVDLCFRSRFLGSCRNLQKAEKKLFTIQAFTIYLRGGQTSGSRNLTSIRRRVYEAVGRLSAVQVKVGVENRANGTRSGRVDDFRWELTRSVASRGNSVSKRDPMWAIVAVDLGQCIWLYPNANVTHSASLRQRFRHLSSTLVSVFLKVLSNGSIAPRAIRSKQSVKSRIRNEKILRDDRNLRHCRLSEQSNMKISITSQPKPT